MITELTPEQEARLPEFRDKWLKIGLSTEPANRPEAERGINLAYECVGLKPPKEIVWCDSPLSMAIVYDVLQKSLPVPVVDTVVDTVRASVRASVVNSVGAPVGTPVGTPVRASVRASVVASVVNSVVASVLAPVRASVVNSVRASVVDSVVNSVVDTVWAKVGTPVWASVVNSVEASVLAPVEAPVWSSVVDSVVNSVVDTVVDTVRASVWASVRIPVRASVVGAMVYGSHDAHWFGFYEYFHDVCDMKEETGNLSGLWLQAQNAGWWLPCENVCFVSERHNILNHDEQGRLHCADGLAVGYPDGWGVYAWHGVRVPEDVILHPEQITPKRILDEDNAEIRRVMVERYGADHLVSEVGHKIQEDEYGKLYRVQLDDPDDEPIVMVQVNDASTERQYFLRVPPHIRTAHEAVAWTFEMDASAYQPSIQT